LQEQQQQQLQELNYNNNNKNNNNRQQQQRLQIDRCADLRRRIVGLKLNLFVGGDFEAGRGILVM
jgi:hypothetical protein